MADALTPEDMRDLIASVLASVAGGTLEGWTKKIGLVTRRPLVEDIRSNWRVESTGSLDEVDAIAKAVEVVRTAHPYVAGISAWASLPCLPDRCHVQDQD